MERTNSEDVLGDWREENIDIEDIIQGRQQNQTTQGGNLPFQNGSGIGIPQRIGVPYSPNATRPSVLDLSNSGKYDQSSNGGQAGSPHSPHQSPSPHYQQATTFNYSQPSPHDGRVSPMPNQGQMSPHPARSVSPLNHPPTQAMSPVSPHHSPVSPVAPRSHSPHHQLHSPVSGHSGGTSPHSPHPSASPYHPSHSPVNQMHHQQGQISPHMYNHGGPVSPGAPMDARQAQAIAAMQSLHDNRSRSVSPVPGRDMSPAPGASSVFGRYAHSPVHSAHSEYSSDCDSYYGGMKRGAGHFDKNSQVEYPHTYKAKRERNNIAVRKSREKKKQREMETEKRVKELSDDNANLQAQLDMKIKEVSLMKNLYKTIGIQLPPEINEKLEAELSKLEDIKQEPPQQ